MPPEAMQSALIDTLIVQHNENLQILKEFARTGLHYLESTEQLVE